MTIAIEKATGVIHEGNFDATVPPFNDTNLWIVDPVVPTEPKELWEVKQDDTIGVKSGAEADLINANLLAKAKSDKIDAIDARTVELIVTGFVYSGQILSLSVEAQSNITNAWAARNEAWFSSSYPIEWSTKNGGSISLADATAIDGMYQAAFATKKAHLDSGRALKLQIDAATTLAEVAAVVDNR